MGRREKFAIAIVAALAGLGAFLAAVTSRGADARRPAPPLTRWLKLSAEQARAVEQADPGFPNEVEPLKRDLRDQRERLATLLEDPATPKEKITEQVERAISAQDLLTRRVAQHLLAIRPHLTADQQKQLLGLCASSVRSPGGWGWRGGEDSGSAKRHGPPWQDNGQQKGRGWRGGSER